MAETLVPQWFQAHHKFTSRACSAQKRMRQRTLIDAATKPPYSPHPLSGMANTPSESAGKLGHRAGNALENQRR